MSDRRIPTVHGHSCHALNTRRQYFEPLISGVKTFEIRTNDRVFAVGDYLWLREFDPVNKELTGRFLVKQVCFVMDAEDFCGLSLGYVALGLTDATSEAAWVITALGGKVEL